MLMSSINAEADLLVVAPDCPLRMRMVEIGQNCGFVPRVVSHSQALPTTLASSRMALVAGEDMVPTLRRLRCLAPQLPIVALIGSGDAGDFPASVEACRAAGASHCVDLGCQDTAQPASLEQLTALCRDARTSGIAGDNCGIVGCSPAIQGVRRFARRIAGSRVTVLIHGPTGAGKEVVALALHRMSDRARRPLVALNCAALPDDLIEGELFGYERGAFSGATMAYPGKLALADGGTLFLDEIGELSAAGQAKLLRAIESRQCYRLGGRSPHTFDVRVIAATNRDLRAEVAAGRFRSDLFYRIAVAQIEMPGLSSRRMDIGPLARHLVAMLAQEQGVAVPQLMPDSIAALEAYDWPGNARELRNVLEVALLSAVDGRIYPADLPAFAIPIPMSPPMLVPCADFGEQGMSEQGLSDQAIREALVQSQGNKSMAARLLGCSRMTIYRHLRDSAA